MSDKVWSITPANSDYKLNENLSGSFVVPADLVKTVKDSDLKKKLKNSLLTLSWMHPGSKGFLVRLDTVQSAKGKGKPKKDETDGEIEEAGQLQCLLNSLGSAKAKKKVYLLDTAGSPFLLQLKKAKVTDKVGCALFILSTNRHNRHVCSRNEFRLGAEHTQERVRRPRVEWLDADDSDSGGDSSASMSSVREDVTEGEECFDYFIPETMDKKEGITEGTLGLPQLSAVRKSLLELRDGICTFHSLGDKVMRYRSKASGEINVKGNRLLVPLPLPMKAARVCGAHLGMPMKTHDSVRPTHGPVRHCRRRFAARWHRLAGSAEGRGVDGPAAELQLAAADPPHAQGLGRRAPAPRRRPLGGAQAAPQPVVQRRLAGFGLHERGGRRDPLVVGLHRADHQEEGRGGGRGRGRR